MIPVRPEGSAGSRSPGTPSQIVEPFRSPVPSAAGTDREDVEPASVYTPTQKSRWLKLAVLLVVALLCIAFAGVVWALIF
jgi:hypothetical protein